MINLSPADTELLREEIRPSLSELISGLTEHLVSHSSDIPSEPSMDDYCRMQNLIILLIGEEVSGLVVGARAQIAS